MKLPEAMNELREASLHFRNADFLHQQGPRGRTEGEVKQISEDREEAMARLDRATRQTISVFDMESASVEAMVLIISALNDALKTVPGVTAKMCHCVLFTAHGTCWHVEGKRAMEQLAGIELKPDA